MISCFDRNSTRFKILLTFVWFMSNGFLNPTLNISRRFTTSLAMAKNQNSSQANALSGRSLLVAVVDNWPFFGLKKDKNKKLVPDSGIDYSVIQTLSEVLNFSYSIVTPADGQWGGPQPDGSFSGMIGMVARGEADLAINEITITDVREQVVDFTNPYFIDSSAISTKALSLLESVFVIFSPFTFEVWLIIIGSIIAAPCVSLLFYYCISKDRRDSTKPDFRFQSVLFNFYKCLVFQNNLISTDLWVLRFLFFSWYLFCYCLYAFYTGTLTAVLAVPTYERPIDFLTDLYREAQAGNVIPVVLNGGSVESVFVESTSGIYQSLYETFAPKSDGRNYADTVDDGLRKAAAGGSAYLDASFSLEMRGSLMGREKFYIGKGRFYMQGYGIACPQNTPMKEILDRTLSQFLAAGLIEKWRKDEVSKVQSKRFAPKEASEESTGGVRALSLKQLQGAFILYFIGLGAALITLLLEIIRYKTC